MEDTTVEEVSNPTHLLILQHGLHGSSLDLTYTQKAFDSNYKGQVVSHVITSNEGFFKTHEGIDKMGTRLADETMEVAKKYPTIKYFSIVGHSLGGLIIRYGISVLYERGFFDSIVPMNFITFASPHVGSRRTPRVFWNPIGQYIVGAFCSHTGKQLMLEDGDKPLLLEMTKPDSNFYKSLAIFKHRCLYANVTKDLHVPYSTAAISSKNPYLEKLSTLKFNAKYPRILEEAEPEEKNEDLNSCFKNDPKRDILREMLSNLRALTWQRVGVHYDSYFAHTHIAGKMGLFNWDDDPTFDSVHHLVDNFMINL